MAEPAVRDPNTEFSQDVSSEWGCAFPGGWHSFSEAPGRQAGLFESHRF